MARQEALEPRSLLAAAPVAIRDTFSGTAMQPLTVAAPVGLLANDRYEVPANLRAELVAPPLHGELQLAADGSFVYSTFGNYGGIDQFRYRAIADGLQSDVVAVTLQMAQQPNVPVAVNDRFRVAEDTLLRADATPLRAVQIVDVPAQQLVYDSLGQQIYALVGDTVVPIDPTTNESLPPQSIGGGVSRIAISDDGNYIFAVTNDNRSLRRFNTQRQQVDQTTTVGSFGEFGLAIQDIQPVPGRPKAVAISQYYPCCSPRQGGILIVEDGKKLPASTAGGLGSSGGGDSITFGTETQLVGYTSSISSFEITVMDVDNTGVHVDRSVGGILSGNTSIRGADGYIYTDGGTVIQVNPLKVVGNLPQSGQLLPEPSAQRIFVLHGSGQDTTVSWFDPKTQKQLGQLPLPELTQEVISWTRFGTDGLAFSTRDGKTMLVRSDLISGERRLGVVTNDSDPENQALTATLVTNVQHGQLTWLGDGTFDYQPAPNYFGVDTFTYRVSDGTNASNIATVTLDVLPVNDAPVGAADNYSSTEDVLLEVAAAQGVLANDSDVDLSTPLTAELDTDARFGTVLLSPNGAFTYRPSNDFWGEDSFTYIVNDGHKKSTPVQVRITVAKLNETPVLVADTYTIQEDAILRRDGTPFISTLLLDQPVRDLVADLTGRRLFVTVPGSATDQTLLEIDPFTGSQRASYAIGRDASQLVISDDGRYLYTVVEDGRAIRVFDLETKTLGARMLMPGSGDFAERVRELYAIPGRPDRILVARYYLGSSPPAGGTWVYTKDGDVLPEHFGQGIGTGGSDILAVDETGTKAYGYQNSISSFDFSYLNISDQGVSYADIAPWGSMLSGYGIGRIAVAGGRLFADNGVVMDLTTRQEVGRFQGGGNFFLDPAADKLYSLDSPTPGAATLRVYQLSTMLETGRQELTGIGTSTGNLTRFGTDGIAFQTKFADDRVNLVLVQSSDISGQIPGGVLANDRDADDPALRVELVSGPQHGTLTLQASGQFVYQPNAEYSGTDAFTYRVVLGEWQSPAVQASIEVLPINDRPLGAGDSYAVNEDATLTVSAAASVILNDRDVENDPMSVIVAGGPAHGTVQLSPDGSFVYQPAANFFGEDSFNYRISDGRGLSEPITVRINVAAQPDITTANVDAYEIGQGLPLVADATEPVPSEPINVTLFDFKSEWKYLDNGSNQGEAWRAFEFDDQSWKTGVGKFGYGEGDEATLVEFGGDPTRRHVTTYFRKTIEVRNVSELSSFRLGAFRDDGLAVYLNGVEIARDQLRPNAGYNDLATTSATDDGRGRRVFQIPVELWREGTNVLAAELHQSAPNTSDATFDAAITAVRRPSLQLTGVLVNDADPDGLPLRAELTTPPAHGSLSLQPDGTFRYQPERTFTGSDRFEYRATDGFGEATTAAVNIVVKPGNVPPLAVADRYAIAPRATLNIGAIDGLLANDSDLEAGPLTTQLVETPKFGQLELRPDGSFTYIPNSEFRFDDSFTYRSSDGQWTSDPVQVDIFIDAPTIVVGEHLLVPNQANQQIPIYVTGGQNVGGINLFVQSGDGGPDLAWIGLPAGTRGPLLTSLDVQTNTIFAGKTELSSVAIPLPQIGFASLILDEVNPVVPANGLLATLTVDTTGLFGGTFDLRISDILSSMPEGPFESDFGGLPARITNGRMVIHPATVVGRHVFYNGSKFDGENTGASAADDRAIAPDKKPLLPGQTATFENYTSYSRGINGVIVDVLNPLGNITLSDFRFRVGNQDDVSRWTNLATQPQLTIRPGEGEGGSDRLTLIWPDGTIRNQWLEVTLRSNASTGLEHDDVFYFGNAVGETGDSPVSSLVNVSDVLATRNHPRGPMSLADITDVYDFNRDRIVTATDAILARDNITTPLTALRRIRPA